LCVSNREKARALFASGAPLCTVESNASRPIAAAAFTIAASTMPPTNSPYHAAATPDIPTAINAERIMVASFMRRLTSGPTKFAPNVAIPERAIAKPNQAVPAISRRNQNAKWKNMNPTIPRKTRIAIAAVTTDGE
jgi:hypothetical protein